ncbi:TonB-dependent receptor [Erythrobacter sp.]|uniref:TonB-dependent receptor n=1 Tax=Erythrobacter sp. TaxID=1042 RepID=UPI001425F310|nr:TonB-dependent receptor [Erythrobacter sp.]QIQ87630.1 MAG: TonB-dependent receptor [Erythrobacter sp.]
MSIRHTRVVSARGAHLRRALLAGAALSCLAAMPQAAHAQDMETDEAAAPEEQVIIVQARRQNETLQEVPVTVTAIGGDTLSRYNIDQVADVVSRVPTLNVQVGGSGSGGQLSLRGVGSSNISAAFDSAVAFDFDGVQVSTMRLVQAGFFDVEQIDVLKGPQSLFFGKSASAGVFAIRSADPTSTWEVGGAASYEFEEDGYIVQGYVSGPLTDTLGMRVAAQFNDIDEYVVLQDGTPAANGRFRGLTNIVARGTLEWQPSPTFDANLKVQYVRNENDGAIQHSDLFCGANGVADPITLLGGAINIPGGYDCNAFDQRYFLPDTAPPLAGGVPTPSAAAGRNGVPFGETDVWFTRLLMNWDITENLTLTSTTGYLNLDAVDFDNYSYGGLLGPGVPGGVGTSDPVNQLEQWTQELRLASDFEGAFNFMLGVFYEDRKFVFDTAQQAVNISFLGPDPVTGFTYDWDRRQDTDTEAFSVFGSVMIDLTEDLELSGGVRYTDEKKTAVITVPYLHTFLQGPGFVSPGFNSGPIEFSDDNFSPEITLRYKATEDINVFASFKTGFKSGGIDNSALPSNSLSQAANSGDFSPLIFQSETAQGGEVGIKTQWADRTFTLNATAYYYVFDDLQVQNFDAVAVQFLTLNAGQVTSQGIDLEANWLTPVDGLSFSGNLSYLDAEFTDTFITSAGNDLDGRSSARAPTWSGNLAFDFVTPISDGLDFGLNGNMIYSGEYFTNEDTRNDFIQDDYVTFDASVSIGAADGTWKVSLIGVNLADEIWVNTSAPRPFLPPTGDDLIFTQNRGRQVFVETRFRF